MKVGLEREPLFSNQRLFQRHKSIYQRFLKKFAQPLLLCNETFQISRRHFKPLQKYQLFWKETRGSLPRKIVNIVENCHLLSLEIVTFTTK